MCRGAGSPEKPDIKKARHHLLERFGCAPVLELCFFVSVWITVYMYTYTFTQNLLEIMKDVY